MLLRDILQLFQMSSRNSIHWKLQRHIEVKEANSCVSFYKLDLRISHGNRKSSYLIYKLLLLISQSNHSVKQLKINDANNFYQWNSKLMNWWQHAIYTIDKSIFYQFFIQYRKNQNMLILDKLAMNIWNLAPPQIESLIEREKSYYIAFKWRKNY